MPWRLDCMHVPLYQSLCQTLFILVPPASNKGHVHQTCLSCISSSLPAKSEITHTNSSHAGISTVKPNATEAEEAKQSSSPEPLQTPGNAFALFCSQFTWETSLYLVGHFDLGGGLLLIVLTVLFLRSGNQIFKGLELTGQVLCL